MVDYYQAILPTIYLISIRKQLALILKEFLFLILELIPATSASAQPLPMRNSRWWGKLSQVTSPQPLPPPPQHLWEHSASAPLPLLSTTHSSCRVACVSLVVPLVPRLLQERYKWILRLEREMWEYLISRNVILQVK